MEYLSKSKLTKHKKRANKILNELNINLGKEWDIDFNLVGSASRNLVIPSNNGYDFDYHIHLKKYPIDIKPRKIKEKFRIELNQIVKRYLFKPFEDSTHVLTTKNMKDGKILYSYDFAILRKVGNKAEILKNRKNGQKDAYQFVEIPDYPKFIKEMKKIVKAEHVNYLRDCYYRMKIKEQEKRKDDRTLSISLLLMSINQTKQKFKI